MDLRLFETSVEGRLNKYKIKTSFDPVYEALTNSIHAVEDQFGGDFKKGVIKVTFERESRGQLSLDSETSPKINKVIIEDNGIGFNEQNFKSFLTIDSLYKSSKGGQGVGRLSWLKVFEEVSIESGFLSLDDEMHYVRPFKFLKSGIQEDLVKDNVAKEIYTTLILNNIRSQYEINFPQELDKIAGRIIQHFLPYFATGNIPQITITDPSKGESLVVNASFSELFGKNQFNHSFDIKGENFKVTTLLSTTSSSKSKVSLIAHKRAVSSEYLENYIPLTKKTLVNDEGREFRIFSFIEGSYLDANVNESRSEFVVINQEDSQGDLISALTLNEIITEAAKGISEKLSNHFLKVREDNIRSINNYINDKSPRYKTLVKYKKQELENLVFGNERELDTKLRAIEYDLEIESISAAHKITDQISSPDEKHIEELSEELFEKVSDLGKSSLAQYVCNRKIVLEVLKKSLEAREDKKFPLEKVIHRLIFPLGKTSDELNYEDQNLWILDERLSYHNYLASDVSLKKMRVLDNDSQLEPDLAIFKGPIAITDEEAPFNSVVIVEFKRPQRSDYKSDDNPIDQVLDYVRKIRNKQAKDRAGRIIDISPSTRFFCYIACDTNKKLEDILENRNFKRTPDPGGYFLMHEQFNAYIEVSTYDKVLKDAFRRNKVFFEHLKI